MKAVRWLLLGAALGAAPAAVDGLLFGALFAGTAAAVAERVAVFAAAGALLGGLVGLSAALVGGRMVLQPPDEEPRSVSSRLNLPERRWGREQDKEC